MMGNIIKNCYVFLTFQCVNRSSKIDDIEKSIIQAVTERCSCRFTSSDINDGAFSCFGPQGNYLNSVVYKAIIRVKNSDIDANQLVNATHHWVQMKPSIVVNEMMIDIDSSCLTIRDPFDDKDCFTNDTVSTQPAVSTQQTQTTSDVSAAFIIILIAGIIITILIFLGMVVCIQRYRHTVQPKRFVYYP